MENNYCVDPNESTEFKTRLQVGEVIIVDFCNIKLNYNRNYVSVVKDIVIDNEKHIYKCRLDNFNIEFDLRHQVPWDKTSAAYGNSEENIYAYVYKIEDFERHINDVRYYTDKNSLYGLSRIIKKYQALVEAMKLKEQLQQGQ